MANNIYETFKFFKNNYVQLNIASEIYFIGDSTENKINLVFSKDSEFYLLIGTIDAEKYPENEFFKWLLRDDISGTKLNIEEVIGLGKVLKKNAVSLDGDKNNFTFKFLDKETGEENIILVKNEVIPKYVDQMAQTRNIIDTVTIAGNPNVEIPDDVLNNEILQFHYLEDSKTYTFESREGKKIIEIPMDRIKSILKKSKVSLSFSNIDSFGRRFVTIYSANDEGITLSQLFVTI